MASTGKLVIVESPAKARTISKILGGEYRIFASMGHVRDLPDRTFGVDVKNNFAPQYEESKSRAKVIKQLQSEAKDVSDIYLATDPDREGEAIAWHLKEILAKKAKAKFHRVTFHEITRNAINKAFQAVSDIDMDLVNSQQARRVLDRVVGYQISPLLWSRVEKGISAGRVQSVALRLVCEREREITSFVTKEYWTFFIDIEAFKPGSSKIFRSKLFKIDGDKFEVGSEADALKVFNAVEKAKSFKTASVETKPRKRYAPPPFITSTMQQAASSNISFSANFTMKIAQQLYEGMELGSGDPVGLITYMRTDSFTIAKEAQEACKKYISSEIGSDYVPASPNFFKNKGSAQEAHEAIRPTDVTLTPEKAAPYLDEPQLKLYTLVWKRFVASQMAPAEQKQTIVDISCDGADGKDYTFRTTALVTVFPGFKKVYEFEDKPDDEEEQKGPAVLAELKQGDSCFLKNLEKEQKFTEPPPRYSEASLIRELESNGIGRPSTYASILETIQKRLYVNKDKGRLYPTELGMRVAEYLIAKLPVLFDVGFTAGMEEKLDKVEEGSVEWTTMLKEFYTDFSTWLGDAKNIGAPEKEKAQVLISILEKISKWIPKEKRGTKSYDDEKFFNSVKDKFQSDSTLSPNQWNALLSIAVKYAEQLPDLEKQAEKGGFLTEINEYKEKIKAFDAKRESSKASAGDTEKYTEIFTALENIKWAAPEKRGPRVYDDGKFFKSLKNQADSGKLLSEKQIAALGKMAGKYKDQITDYDKISSLMNITAPGESSADASPANAAADEETAKLLKILSEVKTWGEPVKKGRRTYDDKSFYESLSSQFTQGRKLSDKQLAALKKLAGKYSAESES